MSSLKKIIETICQYNAIIFIVALLFMGLTSFQGQTEHPFTGIYVLDSVFALLTILSIIDIVLRNKKAKYNSSGLIMLGLIALCITWLSCLHDGLPILAFRLMLYGFLGLMLTVGILWHLYPDVKEENQIEN